MSPIDEENEIILVFMDPVGMAGRHDRQARFMGSPRRTISSRGDKRVVVARIVVLGLRDHATTRKKIVMNQGREDWLSPPSLKRTHFLTGRTPHVGSNQASGRLPSPPLA